MAAPAPAPPPIPAPAVVPRRNTALRWPLTLAAAVAVIVIGALLYYSQSRDQQTTAVELTPPASTTTTVTTTTTPDGSSTTFENMRDVVTSYYAELPDNTKDAWKMLSPAYQEQTGGMREYRNFWATVRSVTVGSVEQRDDSSVSAQLTYVLSNGATDSERRWFDIEPVDGTLVIADSGLG